MGISFGKLPDIFIPQNACSYLKTLYLKLSSITFARILEIHRQIIIVF